MARAFKSTPKGFVADLEKTERRLLRTLFQDVIQLLDADDLTVSGRPGSDDGGAQQDRAPQDGSAEQDDTDEQDGPAEQDGAFWDIVSGLGPLGTGEGNAADVVGRTGPDEDPAQDPAPPPAPSREPPRDEALARLLPSGVDGDDGAAGEFRALTEDSVRQAQTADLQRAVAALQANPVVLSEPDAVSFGRALNDVRLVLSARLGIDSEEDAEKVHGVDDWSAAQDVESYMALLYNFTTWLLETLMTALSTRLPD